MPEISEVIPAPGFWALPAAPAPAPPFPQVPPAPVPPALPFPLTPPAAVELIAVFPPPAVMVPNVEEAPLRRSNAAPV